MKRRDFIAALGGAAVWPLPAHAQPATKLPVIGFLNGASPDTYAFNAASFREGLRQAGFVDGENVRIEDRWGKGSYDDLPRLAAELGANNVLPICATRDVSSAPAAQAASQTMPLVV